MSSFYIKHVCRTAKPILLFSRPIRVCLVIPIVCWNSTSLPTKPHRSVFSLQDPQPVSGAEGRQKPPPAGPDAPGDGGDGTGASESQQRVIHTELPEQEALLHLVVKEWKKRRHKAGPQPEEGVKVVWIEERNPVSSVCRFQERWPNGNNS